jgi:hypothetical protein
MKISKVTLKGGKRESRKARVKRICATGHLLVPLDSDNYSQDIACYFCDVHMGYAPYGRDDYVCNDCYPHIPKGESE